MKDEIQLTLPAQEDFRHVAQLVVSGIAARREVTYEDLADLQVGVDALLACREDDEDIVITLCVEEGEVRAKIGPFEEDALARLDEGPVGLAPRHVLETVCSSVTVDGEYVTLTKRVA